MAGFWDTLQRPFSALAPMEDVTDTVFRQMIATYAPPDVFFTEFVNVDGMCSAGRDAVIHRLRYTETERPIVAQIWGLKPENFERAARDIRKMGFDGVDLNMGCSVRKVLKTGACAKLIENTTLAGEIIRATVEGAAEMPVSVKTRIGYTSKKTIEWCGFLLEHNLAALTVHGRIARQTYRTPADWGEIAKVVSLRDHMTVKTAVIGNGDVSCAGEMPDLHSRYRVDGVMIGRAALHNPFVFSTSGGKTFADLPAEKKAAMLKEHLLLHRKTWGDEKNIHELKKLVKTYISNFKGATELRSRLMAANNFDEMIGTIESTREKV